MLADVRSDWRPNRLSRVGIEDVRSMLSMFSSDGLHTANDGGKQRC